MAADIQTYALTKVQDEEEILINYKPWASVEKWVKYRFSAWSTFKSWFVMTIVVLFFGFGGPGYTLKSIMQLIAAPSETEFTTGVATGTATAIGTTAIGTVGGVSSAAATQAMNIFFLQLLGVLFAGALGLIGLRYTLEPTHIKLSRKGIGLEWHRGLFSYGARVPWEKLKYIQVSWPPDKTSPQDCLILLKTADDSTAFKMRFGAIGSVEERQKMLRGIERWGGQVGRDPQLLEMLTPPQDHSYTELWLQALSAPPKRERLTPLHEGAELQEGGYRVAGQLGVGGQGTAYLAYTHENDDVVLKEFILPVYVDINVRRQSLDKMQHEAAMLRRLDNPRIVRLLDFFVEDHRGYLVLERIDGLSLRAMVEQGTRFTQQEVISLASQMCEALSYLHGLSPPVVHRDFTPDNLILGKDDLLKVVDFNVAQQTEATTTGTVVGKHCYISPEQFRGKPTVQSDIYSMGASLYYLLTGEDPDPITSSHPIKKVPEILPSLDAIVAKATTLDAKKRYLTIEELMKDLSAVSTVPESEPSITLAANQPAYEDETDEPDETDSASSSVLHVGKSEALLVEALRSEVKDEKVEQA